MPRRRRFRRTGLAAFAAVGVAFAATGCASGPTVARAYDGRRVVGRFIEADAYAAFLAGSIAEAAGDLRGALRAYERAGGMDRAGPEIPTRIGAVRCAIDRHDRRADEAFEQAVASDPAYPDAWVARAKCFAARGDRQAADEASLAAAGLDPRARSARFVARIDAGSGDEAQRRQLVALTARARDREAALRALGAWAEAHGDAELWARSMEALARAAPQDRDEVGRAAEALAGAGAVTLARRLAAAAVDAWDPPIPATSHPLASRLALDEAVARDDDGALRARAVRTRSGLDEAAARSFVEGDARAARSLAGEVAAADPADGEARLVLAAASRGDVAHEAAALAASHVRIDAAAWTAASEALARGASPSTARSTMAAVEHDPPVAGDEELVRASVALASRGAIDGEALSPDARVELRVLEAAPSGGGAPARPEGAPAALDPVHAFLALALDQPGQARTRDLAARLARMAGSDRLVAVGQALVLLGSAQAVPPGATEALLARDPTDPLVAAVALRLAERAGDADAVRRARAAWTAIAGGHADHVTE